MQADAIKYEAIMDLSALLVIHHIIFLETSASE